MDRKKFERIVLLRDKRENIEKFLNRFTNTGGNAGVIYYSDIFGEMLHLTFHEFEDLQNEFNDYVKIWAIEKIKEIDNEIATL